MEEHGRTTVFPFTAIVGLEDAKTALLAVAVNPLIGGVLLRGDKGTGKTTLVRSLANLLPEIKVVADCPFNCDPENPALMCDSCYKRWSKGEELPVAKRKMRVVDLPLSVTPDRLIGTIDVERFLREGVKAVSPGLLAEANRNILYIDEVNLLDDYIADLILDAAAYGWNIIEREHVSFRHPSRFILVGSMNPEEGELRPQLLDRFGLVVDVKAPMDPELRMEIVRRVEEYSNDPVGFYKKYEPLERELCERIVYARKIIKEVEIDDDLLRMIAEKLVEMRIKTCRAEITIVRTAKALAALDGRRKVSEEDVEKAMKLALPHRIHLEPFENTIQKKPRPFEHNPRPRSTRGSRDDSRENNNSNDKHGGSTNPVAGGGNELVMKPSRSPTSLYIQEIKSSYHGYRDNGFSRRSRKICRTRIGGFTGAPIGYIYPVRDPRDVDLVGTIIASKISGNGLVLAEKLRRTPVPVLTMICLDASGSMNYRKRIMIAKAIAHAIARRSYTLKTWLSLIVFRGEGVKEYIPPSRNYRRVIEVLDSIPSGRRTPLSACLYRVIREAELFRRKYRDAAIEVFLITDGKANVSLTGKNVVDELRTLSGEIRRNGIRLYIVDPRGRGFDPGYDFIGLIAKYSRAKVIRI